MEDDHRPTPSTPPQSPPHPSPAPSFPPAAMDDQPSTSSSSSSSSSSDQPSSSVQEENGAEQHREERGGEEIRDNVVEEEHEEVEEATAQLIRHRRDYSYEVNNYPVRQSPQQQDEETPTWIFLRDDTWSCAIVVLTFWFFVSLTLILGIYGSETLELSPYSSILLQPNPIFVQYVKVEKSSKSTSSPVLYGLRKPPSINGTKKWSKSVSASVKSYSHKEWLFFLNEGSHITISYNTSGSSSLLLIIAQGDEEMAEWLEDPSYPNTTLSWNIVYGSGIIKQDMSTSSTFYVAVGNLNTVDVKIEMNLTVRSSVYDTSDAYYKCSLASGSCTLRVLFPGGNTAVLSSPGPQEGLQMTQWYVELSYEPRWLTYLVGIGGMTLLMLVAFHLLNKFQGQNEYGSTGLESERAPLLTQKDDDLISWGSSYDSASNDEEEHPEDLEKRLYEGRHIGEGETSNTATLRQLCVICFDAPRDCFFLPCGHCAACFACATRIAEAAGTCPICRRRMKKVRKIFTV